MPLPCARPPPTFLPPRTSAPDTVHADGHGTATFSPFVASARGFVRLTVKLRPGAGPDRARAVDGLAVGHDVDRVDDRGVGADPAVDVVLLAVAAWITSLPNGILHEYQEQWELVASP